MSYIIKKAPKELLDRVVRVDFPLVDLKAGEMFEIPNNAKERARLHNVIKSKKSELNGKKFSVRSIDNNTAVCIRIK